MLKKVDVSKYGISCYSFCAVVAFVAVVRIGVWGDGPLQVWVYALALMLVAVAVLAILALNAVRRQYECGEAAVLAIHRTFLSQADVDRGLHQLYVAANQAASRPVPIAGVSNGAVSVLEERSREISARLNAFQEARAIAQFSKFLVLGSDDDYIKEPPYHD